MNKITLLINCKDRPNIIASVTNFMANNQGNIVYIDQHVDREQNIFFMRLECEFESDSFSLKDFKDVFRRVLANKFELKWRMYAANKKPRMALFVSKYDHCLYDILGRYNSGVLFLEIPFILSNHEDLRPIAESFNIPF